MGEIKVDFSKTIEAMGRVQRKQIPFVAAVSLTRLAQKSQKGVKKNMKKSFTLRSPRVIKGVRIKPAKKNDFFKGTIQSQVNELDDFMVQHETGKDKTPGGSKALAIPTKFQQQTGRTSTGKMKVSKRPKRLLKKGVAKKRKWGRHKKPKPFIMTFKSGKQAIVIRKGKDKLPVRTLYSFKSSAKIDKKLKLEEITNATAKRNYSRVFYNEYQKAIK